jgi:hypothetical protein
MSASQRRRWSAEEKLRILEEARQADQTVSVPSLSDCARPVLCLAEASPAGGAGSLAPRSTRAQANRSQPAATDRDRTAAGGGDRTERREPATEKRALAIGSRRRHKAEEKALLLKTVAQAQEQSVVAGQFVHTDADHDIGPGVKGIAISERVMVLSISRIFPQMADP